MAGAGWEDRLLRGVGSALRARREAADLSRRELAERSGVSERFIAQIEAGRGNASLLRLAELARALGVPLAEWVSLAPPAGHAGRRVALLGLRGAGKSTVGPRLARRLRLPFLELDHLAEEAAGLPLAQVFEIHGEPHFRVLEREVLEGLLAGRRGFVLATGGGIVGEPATWRLLEAGCRTVWLRARPEDHYERVLAQGDRRPMAQRPRAMAELRALLEAREALYARAELVVDTSGVTPQ
ncbi:MAG: helix-turn-helix domain-containing protein, partial [Planctomycetes bacterium]|nr:helix-turn-helix domain-containing protein [Planctomycetota bacterium]